MRESQEDLGLLEALEIGDPDDAQRFIGCADVLGKRMKIGDDRIRAARIVLKQQARLLLGLDDGPVGMTNSVRKHGGLETVAYEVLLRQPHVSVEVRIGRRVPDEACAAAAGVMGGNAGVGAADALVDDVRSQALQDATKVQRVRRVTEARHAAATSDAMQAVAIEFGVVGQASRDITDVVAIQRPQMVQQALDLVLGATHEGLPMHGRHDAKPWTRGAHV